MCGKVKNWHKILTDRQHTGHAGQFVRPQAQRFTNPSPLANTLSFLVEKGNWYSVSWLLTTPTMRGSIPLFHQAKLGPPEFPKLRSQFSVSSSSPPLLSPS